MKLLLAGCRQSESEIVITATDGAGTVQPRETAEPEPNRAAESPELTASEMPWQTLLAWDIAAIDVPPDWVDQGEAYGARYFMGEGTGGSVYMSIRPPRGISVGNQAIRVFMFDDGYSGTMIEFDDNISWARDDIPMTASLDHFGDRLMFDNNEELVLRIAGTLRPYSQLRGR